MTDLLHNLNLSITNTLKERGKRYGSFKEHARITQSIKTAMINSPNWNSLSPDKRESLDMIAHKIGRILNGDPNYIDNWRDIVGYSELVKTALLKTNGSTDSRINLVHVVNGKTVDIPE